MNATCAPSFELVRRLTENGSSPLVRAPHKGLIKRVFDYEVWCREEDEENLVQFVDQLMGLKRQILFGGDAVNTHIRVRYPSAN